MYVCNCSLIIEKRPFNGWMTAAVLAKLTRNLWKKGRLQLEKSNTLNKNWIQLFPGLNTVTCKEKNVFLRTTTTSWITAVFDDLLFR